MPTTAPDARQAVAVGVLRNAQQQLLVQQRLPHQAGGGLWEFPGGKLEVGETAEQALARELGEELGVQLDAQAKNLRHLLNLPFDYSHAKVWLQVYVVDDFCGAVCGREGQPIRWLELAALDELALLPAVYPILQALRVEAEGPGVGG